VSVRARARARAHCARFTNSPSAPPPLRAAWSSLPTRRRRFHPASSPPPLPPPPVPNRPFAASGGGCHRPRAWAGDACTHASRVANCHDADRAAKLRRRRPNTSTSRRRASRCHHGCNRRPCSSSRRRGPAAPGLRPLAQRAAAMRRCSRPPAEVSPSTHGRLQCVAGCTVRGYFVEPPQLHT